MAWPIATDYQEALQNPRLCFADIDLEVGTVRLDRLGLPRPISGAFATVFQMDTPTGRWAVRCFLKRVEDHQRRYTAISNHLRSVALKSAVGFDFIPQGIRIRSQWYPILKMQWVEGEPLNSYIAKSLSQPYKLLQLAREWSETMASLRAAEIAHGDLQHGNVLVTSSGLRLIDYDGMYVPALAGYPSIESGHRNYQHPSRDHDPVFGPQLDNFSAWVIFCSIMSVALDPRLWQLLNGGDECLLFRREDFQRPDLSRAFQALESSRPEVKVLAAHFRSLLRMPLRQIPALDGRIVPQPAESPQQAAAGPLPEWIAGHTTTTTHARAAGAAETGRTEDPGMVATADWIIDHLVDRQAPVATLRSHPLVIERLALLLTACVTATTGWAANVTIVPLMAGTAIIAATVGAFALLLMVRYRQLAGIKEKRIAVASLKTAREALEERQLEIGAVEALRHRSFGPLEALEAEFRALPEKINSELRGVQARLDRVRWPFAKKRQETAAEEMQAMRELEQGMLRRRGVFVAERNGLDQREREELAAALKALQDAHVNSRLANATISNATLPGIGPKLKERLKAWGIFTARDVEIWRVRRVDGIGDAKANQLLAWKVSVIRAANVPISLPSDREFNIRNRSVVRRQWLENQIRDVDDLEARQRQALLEQFSKRRALLADDERNASRQHEAALQAIHAKLQNERVRIDAEHRAMKAKLIPLRKEYEQKLAELSRQTLQQRFQVCRFEKELERYRGLSPGKYILKILGIARAA